MIKMTKNSIKLEMMQFLNIAKREEKISLMAELDAGFSFADSDGPMPFESAFLSEGYRKGMNNDFSVFIPEEQIIESINNPINKDFPIKFNHDYDTPNVGVVLELYFNKQNKMLTAIGRINDVETANAIRKLQKEGKRVQVSVTVFGSIVNKNNRAELHNLRYNELSIVKKGENPDTYIKEKQ